MSEKRVEAVEEDSLGAWRVLRSERRQDTPYPLSEGYICSAAATTERPAVRQGGQMKLDVSRVGKGTGAPRVGRHHPAACGAKSKQVAEADRQRHDRKPSDESARVTLFTCSLQWL